MARDKRDRGQVQLPPVAFTAGGDSDEQRTSNLETAQQAPGYPDVTFLVADAVAKRVETVMLDFTRQAVAVRYQIDGVWHDLSPRDRQSGDAMLATLKCIAGLNPNERAARQQGKFKISFHKAKGTCTLTSQGVKTGERAMLDLLGDSITIESLEDLGMREKVRGRFRELINADSGMIIISGMPKGGLTTAWVTCLSAADRFVRDFVSLQSEDYDDPEVVNVNPVTYKAGQTPASILRQVLLKEPDVLAIPELNDEQTARLLCEHVVNEQGLIVTRIHAKRAEEALLRVLMLKVPADTFSQAVTAVLNVRLVRKLCGQCKQPYPPNPQLLQQLGIPPGRVNTLYRPWQPPPQGQTDHNGNTADWQCPSCNGLGYRGRIGIFEWLEVNDPMRQALTKSPKLEDLRQLSRQAGNTSHQEEGILVVCQGVTALAEVQRVLKQ